MKYKNYLMLTPIVLTIVGVLSILVMVFRSSTTISTVEGCKIIHLQQQQIIKETTTDIRYLVITDKETFVVKNSLINSKFNNSDLFFRLSEGKTYTFIVSGLGKGFILDYRNILEAKEK